MLVSVLLLCVCSVHVYPRLTSRWILVCLYLLFLLLRTLLLYGGCLLSFGWICLSSLLLTLLYACIYFTYVSTRIIYVVSKCYASWCNVYSFLLYTAWKLQLEKKNHNLALELTAYALVCPRFAISNCRIYGQGRAAILRPLKTRTWRVLSGRIYTYICMY